MAWCSWADSRGAWAGGDKARTEIGGVSILDRVLATLSAQCTSIIINPNGDPKQFADTGLTVVPDSVPDFEGPLARIPAGLDWLAREKGGIEWIVSVPGDCPFLPDDLVERLHLQDGHRRVRCCVGALKPALVGGGECVSDIRNA